MQIMNDKGFVERDTRNKGHIYKAVITDDETKQIMLDKLLESAFGGSAMNLVLQTLGNYKTSKDEIEQIKKIIDEIERKEL
jgi:predicted transcriptional regulator